jgi:hypothetical protein
MVEELKSFFGEVKTFDEMVQRAEEKGVFVLKSGYIKSVRRVLDPKEFKGFVLYDSVAPVVFLYTDLFDITRLSFRKLLPLLEGSV